MRWASLALAACPLFAQQSPAQPPTAQTEPKPAPPNAPQAAPDPQQPGTGAQVRTGTTSGLEADERLQNLLADHQFILLESQLDKLPPEQAQLYRGILANRSNDNKTIHRVA